MKRSLWSTIAAVSVLAAAMLVPGRTEASLEVWQADLQVRTLEITKTRGGMNVRIVVYTEKNDEARDVRLVVLLPVGVGVDRLAQGCAASAGPSMVPSLRAIVACDLGALADRGYREVQLGTTLPPEGLQKRLGVFAYSATPDPIPGNNYAERALP
jgi:hypothetical protein